MELNHINEKTLKKIYRFLTVTMSITTGIVLSAYNIVASGHFTVVLLLMSIFFSSTLSILLGIIIPVNKISDEVTSNIGNPVIKSIFSNILNGTFYSVIISTILSFIMIGMVNTEISNGIEELHDRVNSLTDLISAQEQVIASEDMSSEKKAELTESVEQLRDEAEKLIIQIQSMEENRPNPLKRLPKALLAGLIISWCLNVMLQPVYLRIALHIFDVNK